MRSYDDFLQGFPPAGRTEHGEVEVIPGGRVVFEDRWTAFLLDRVRFPNGEEGTYARVLRGRLGGPSGGVALIARPGPSGPEFAFVTQWRHALNGWSVETPRGGFADDERSAAAGILREVEEETGLGAPDLWVSLGTLANDTGILAIEAAYGLALYVNPPALHTTGAESTEAFSAAAFHTAAEWAAEAIAVPPGRPRSPRDGLTAGAFGLLWLSGGFDRLNRVLLGVASKANERADTAFECSGDQAAAVIAALPLAALERTNTGLLLRAGSAAERLWIADVLHLG